MTIPNACLHPDSPHVSDRRTFPRVPGSALPTLAVLTGRSTNVAVLDISDGGVLIETPIRVTPGDRETLVLDGKRTIKIAGWAVRVEVTRLAPLVTYRTAIRFAAPITVEDLERSLGPAVRRVSRRVLDRFVHWVRELPGVHAVRVSSSWRRYPGTEPVYFAVPASSHGEGRRLQVFFASGAIPTAEQFAQLRQMALLASDLPDFDVASSSFDSVKVERPRRPPNGAQLIFRAVQSRKRSDRAASVYRSSDGAPRIVPARTLNSRTANTMQQEVMLVGAFPDSALRRVAGLGGWSESRISQPGC